MVTDMNAPKGPHLQDVELPSCLDSSTPNQPYLRDVSQLQRSNSSCPNRQVLKNKGVFLRCEGPKAAVKDRPVSSSVCATQPLVRHCPLLQGTGDNPWITDFLEENGSINSTPIPCKLI